MLSLQEIAALQVTSSFPKKISNLSFQSHSSLWIKQQHFYGFNNNEVSTNRYEFFKIGKTMGLQERRYLSYYQGHLFYFNNPTDTTYIGYCNLQTVYVQWLQLSNHRYLLLLSNGNQTSQFFFNQPDFWHECSNELNWYLIQFDFCQKYSVLCKIGEGSFSEVFKVTQKNTGQILAAKIINKKNEQNKQIANSERTILRQLIQIDGISTFRQFFQNQNKYMIVCEYFPGKTLTSIQKEQDLPTQTIKKLMRDLLKQIRQCHNKHIIHRDIKPKNIIVDPKDMKPKLIDFGLAIDTTKSMQVQNYCKCGTYGYIAPQMLTAQSTYYKSYSYKCDIFSVGIICYSLLMGTNPPSQQSLDSIQSNPDLSSINQKQIKTKYGQAGVLFIQKMIAAKPNHRYTAQQALNSSFLKEEQQSISTLQQQELMGL